MTTSGEDKKNTAAQEVESGELTLVISTDSGLAAEHPERISTGSVAIGESIQVQGHNTDAEVLREEWITNGGLAKVLGVSHGKVAKIAKEHADEHPEWFEVFEDVSGQPQVHFAPDLVNIVKAAIGAIEDPPQGWLNNTATKEITGAGRTTILTIIGPYREEHPEWFKGYRARGSRVVEFYHPDLVKIIQKEVGNKAPEGWEMGRTLSRELKVSDNLLQARAEQYREEHPEWFKDYRNSKGQRYAHFAPELVATLRAEISGVVEAPEDWSTTNSLAETCALSSEHVRKLAEQYREEHPEWFAVHRDRNSHKTVLHYSPELVALVKAEVQAIEPAPKGWSTTSRAATKLGVDFNTAVQLAEQYREEHPEWFVVYRTGQKRPHLHLAPELVAAMRKGVLTDAPQDWITKSALAIRLQADIGLVFKVADEFREDRAGEFAMHRGETGNYEFISPALQGALSARVTELVNQRNESREQIREQEFLREDVREFLSGIDEEGSVEHQEFKDLLGLFGAERAVDILYRFRPEYRKLPVDYVRSSLADYLGDYLVIKGEFSLGGLKTSAELLADTEFKDGLVEVIKTDCLKLLNRASRTGSEFVTFEAVAEYVEHIREETKDFSTPDLQQVLDEVEAYYDLLFQNIHKPDQFVDELAPGRMFPDINQRINVQEIAFKHRVLIADEMGTGKSASVIMAKEILGVKQAVIVVPGNVVEVWQGYLTDYFKEGQAPSVLTVESPNDLVGIDSASYDYVIISQERLNEEYTDGLLALDYGMLIVDEMHKLKNITDGRRAESVIRLAEKIEDDGTGYLALLSGTPVPNKPSDIAMTLKLLYPDEFKDIPNKQLVSQIINGDILNIRSLLVPRMQMKSLAESVSMPNLEEVTHVIEISQEEKDAYEILVEEDELTANEKMQLLRQFMLNPDMLDATPNIIGSKVKAVGEELQKTFATKDKVVMFVNGYIEGVIRGDTTIVPNLNLPDDVHVVTIEGDVPKSRRLEIQEELRTAGHKVLLLVSGQTADVGVDFSAAQEIFFYNEPWTQYDKLQQRGRVYRPGLVGDLVSHTFITAGTIEDGMHRYIESKYQAVEKLLRGVPITDIEKEMLRQAEKQVQPDLEFNADLAEHYFSSWDKMMKIYGHVKELGEEDFKKFLAKYDRLYAESYAELVGSRSYQANAGRLAGSLISKFVDEKGQEPGGVRVLDIASGPEMLKRHIPERLADRVVSLDINPHHFKPGQGQRVLGSFARLPIADKSIDYANLSLSWHYTSFTPTRQNLERMQVLQEINRVLPQGGRAVVTMIYSMDLRDIESFNALVGKLGFKVVGGYSGEASSGTNFKGRVLTLEKTHDCDTDASAIARELGTEGLQGMKFKPTRASLRDVRKMATHFTVGDSKLEVELNKTDQLALEEETRVLGLMENMKRQFGSIAGIPRSALYDSGLSRIWNGKRYVLFKKLNIGSGAVVIK